MTPGAACVRSERGPRPYSKGGPGDKAGTTLRDYKAVMTLSLIHISIRAGDKVAMWYTSANRDEDVFTDPQRFDIRRHPNPHLSFGIAQHFCLGVHLARLEGRVFFDELLSTFPVIKQTGEAQRIRSNLNNGLKSLPVELGR